MKPTFVIGAGRGKLSPILNRYLGELGLHAPDGKLVYEIDAGHYNLRIARLKWEDIKRNYNKFDMILYGADQWLEGGHKAMIGLKYFNQGDCRISLLVPEQSASASPTEIISEKLVATSYPNLAREYLGVPIERVVEMSGSVEAAVGLGWADAVFDVVETGKTARENGLVELKPYIKLGAVFGTCRPEKIPMLVQYGLIPNPHDGAIVAFEGNDGAGKSTIAKHLVQNGLWDNKPAVLVSPYSGDVGRNADPLRQEKLYQDWASVVGKNHWRAPKSITAVYDRNILTCLTELLDTNVAEQDVTRILKSWEPLPDIIFLCDVPPQVSLNRITIRSIEDEFGKLETLEKYHGLYLKAMEYLQAAGIKIVKLDTTVPLEASLEQVKDRLTLEGILQNGKNGHN